MSAVPIPAIEPLLTAPDVAQMLRVSEGWVYQHASGIRRPKLPSVKLGTVVRFRRQDVERFVEEMTR